MHPFPPARELQFLIGKQIIQVRLDPWSIQLHFEGGGHILLQDRVEHVDVTGRVHVYMNGDQRDVGPVFLRDLLLERITELQSEPFFLSLTFENSAVLRLSSNDGPYECGVVSTPECGTMVF